jgi:hypothetical protein
MTVDWSQEKQERVRETWERLTWSRIIVTVVLGALFGAGVGYLTHGWQGAVAMALAILVGLSFVFVSAKRHPDRLARGEGLPGSNWLFAAALILVSIGIVVGVATGNGSGVAGLLPGVLFLGLGHFLVRRFRQTRNS